MTMGERQPIPKKLRFDVFKRDKFACQYCGALGGQVLLHCDHVKSVADGGETTMLNLITACVDCNLGKGARALSDDSALSKQHRQLAELEERRQQLEMMRQWREELARQQVDQIEIIADAFLARSKFRPSDHGNIIVRKWLRKYGLHELLAAIDEAFDLYFKADNEEEWRFAFKRISRVLSMREQEKTDPHIRKLLYIQGILRSRLDDPRGTFVEKIRDALAKGYPIDVLESCAKAADGWGHYVDLLSAWSKRQATVAATEHDEEEIDQDDEPDFVGWEEAQWLGQMFAGALSISPRPREILATSVARECGIEGYISFEITEFPGVIAGFRATGLLQPLGDKPLVAPLENGRWQVNMRLTPISPLKIADCFNRFGALRLSFWDRPSHFARVDEVH